MTDALQQKQADVRARIARVALGDSTVSIRDLATRFGCHPSTVATALAEVGLRGDARGNIIRATTQDLERRKPGNERTTRADVRERIRAAKAADPELTGVALARRFGVSTASVSRILRGES